MVKVFSSALYYPSIDVLDERWLRSASLFWDNIRTIVPNAITQPYSTRFARELSDEGLLIPLKVESNMEEIQELGERALGFVTDPEWNGSLTYSVKKDTARAQFDSRRLDEFAIHREKLPQMILNYLEEGGTKREWHYLPPDFANFYMTLLATKLSERMGLGLVTESHKADKLALSARKDVQFGRPPKYGRYFQAYGPRKAIPRELSPGMLIDMTLKGLSIPNEISAKQVVKFRSDHYEELALFRTEITKLTSDLPTDMPIEALKQAVEDKYKTNVLPALKSLESSLSAQKWEGGFKALIKTAFYSTGGGTLASLAGVSVPAALLAGAGLTLTVEGVTMVNQYKRTRRENPYSYLLSVKNEL